MKFRDLIFLPLLLMSCQIFSGNLWSQTKVDSIMAVRRAALNQLEKKTRSEIQVVWNNQLGVPRAVFGKLTTVGYQFSFRNATDAAISFLNDNKILFGIGNPKEQLKLTRVREDELDMSHLRFQQYKNGLRVRGCELLVHFNKSGSIQSVNGSWIPSFNLSTTPSITKEEAETIALYRAGIGSEVKSIELIFYHLKAKILLAWEVKMSDPERPKMEAIIDAGNGNLLQFDDGLRFIRNIH